MLYDFIKKRYQPNERIWCKLFFFLILFFAAGLRVWYWLRIRYPLRDELYYADLAKTWVLHGFNQAYAGNLDIPPLFILMIKFFNELGLDYLFAGRMVSFLAGLIYVCGFFFLGKLIFDSRKAGLAAMLLAAAQPYLLRYSVLCLRESLNLCLQIWAIYILLQAGRVQQGMKILWFLGGLLLTLACLCRHDSLELLVIVVLCCVYNFIKQRQVSSSVTGNIMLFLTGALMAVILMLLGGVSARFFLVNYFLKIQYRLTH